MSSKARFERLGRELLAEIGLKQPRVCLDQLHGFVRIEDAGWRILAAPWPTSTRAALYVLAHEIGHWLLHTEKRRGSVLGFRDGSTELVLEYEAERYAHRRLRELGVPVPRWITRVGKRRAAAMIDHQLRTTTQSPHSRIAHWAGVDVAKERQAGWGLARMEDARSRGSLHASARPAGRNGGTQVKGGDQRRYPALEPGRRGLGKEDAPGRANRCRTLSVKDRADGPVDAIGGPGGVDCKALLGGAGG